MAHQDSQDGADKRTPQQANTPGEKASATTQTSPAPADKNPEAERPAQDAAANPGEALCAGEGRPRYVRPATPHRTVEPVDDLKHEDGLQDSLRDSDFVVRSHNPFVGRSYKRSRNEMPQLQKELHYGQYLTMPKGGKPIFSSRERKRKIKSAIIMVAIIAALAICMLIILHLSGVIG